jgi:hypothetical protein
MAKLINLKLRRSVTTYTQGNPERTWPYILQTNRILSPPPTLNSDFSTLPTIPPGLTTSRSTTATVMAYAPAAVAGDIPVVTTCAVNEVRFQNARRISQGVWSNVLNDGSPIPLPITLLLEEARTNLLKYSNDIKTGIVGVTTNQSGAWVLAGDATELTTNGTFATDATGWGSTNATLSVAAGELVVTNTATNGYASQTLTGLTVGVTYFASVRCRIGTGTLAKMTLGTTAAGTEYYTNSINAGGAFTIFTAFVATTTTCYVSLVAVGTTGQTAMFDTVSLKRATAQIITTPVASPDGGVNAYGVKAEATDTIFKQTFTGTAASYPSSVYLKRKTGTGTVSISADGTNFTPCTINDTTWTRCEDTRTLTAASYNATLKIATSGDEVYVWGFQCEAGTVPSSTIPTTTAAVTRTTDNASFTGAGLSSWYNPTQGTFVVTASGQYSSAPGNIGVWNQLLTNSGTYVITYNKDVNQSAYLYTPNAQAGVSPVEYQNIPTPTTILLGEQGILNLSKFVYYSKALEVNKVAVLLSGALTTTFDTSYAATTNFTSKFAASAGATAFPFGTRCIYFPKINTSAGTLFDFAWDGNNLMGNSGGSFPAIDVSHGTTFTFAWRGCAFSYFLPTNFTAATDMTAAWRTLTTLIAMPAGLNFPSATNFNVTWQNCSVLTTFPANAFDNSKATVYTSTFTGCALTQTSVDNILVSINQSRINTPSLINGTLNMTGGTSATPSATGLAAKAALVAAGWTVTHN